VSSCIFKYLGLCARENEGETAEAPASEYGSRMKEEQAYWSGDGQVFHCDGWGYWLTMMLRTVRTKESDILKSLQNIPQTAQDEHTAPKQVKYKGMD